MTDPQADLAGEIRLMMKMAALASLLLVGLSLLLLAAGIPGMRFFSIGLLVGCATASINLRVLAAAAGALFQEQHFRAIVGFAASAVVLFGGTYFVSTQPQAAVWGFAVGITLPIFVGFGYARAHSFKDGA